VRIGLASDTHGNAGALERALALFERARVERVFFLGGRLADLDEALARRRGSRDAPVAGAPVPETDDAFLSAFRSALARQAAAGDPLEGRIVRVASRACPEYESGKVPRKQMDLVDGRICCLVHDKAELSRDDIVNASVLFHGNSAAAGLVQIGPRCFVTPGHLRAAAPRDRPATFALLDASARELVLTVFSDACVELRQERAALGVAGKMSVR
jgi:predicted phosphodiesterase